MFWTLIDRCTRCKPIHQLQEDLACELSPHSLELCDKSPQHKLNSCLSLSEILAFGIASTMGAGIFVTTGVVSKNYTGPALFISIIIATICCIMNALCYAEFSAKVPVSGSAYSYAYTTMGELGAFLMGWVLLLEYGLSGAATSKGFASYLDFLLQSLHITNYPPWLTNMYVNKYISFSLIAPLTVLLCTYILTWGVEESSRFNLVVTMINVIMILGFWICGSFYINKDYYEPLMPYNISGVVEGAGLLFFCFIGFDSVSTLSEEVKDPQRDIPMGIIGTLIIVSLLYIGTGIVLSGMIPYYELDPTAPLAEAFQFNNSKTLYFLVSIGAASTTFCTTFTCIMGQPRIFYRMALDGLWFESFRMLDSKSMLPIQGIRITGIVLAIISSFINFETLVRIISAGTLLSYTGVAIGLIVVTYTDNGNEEIPWLASKWFTGTLHCCCWLFAGVGLFLGYSFQEKWNGYVQFGLSLTLVIIVVIFLLIHSAFEYTAKVSTPSSNDEYIEYPTLNPETLASDSSAEKHDIDPLHLSRGSTTFCLRSSSRTHFKCPAKPLVPLAGVFFNSYLLASLKLETFTHISIYLGFGTLIYLCYGLRHSTLNGKT